MAEATTPAEAYLQGKSSAEATRPSSSISLVGWPGPCKMDEHPGVVIVLKSRRRGTGKSTLGVVMLKTQRTTGALIDDSDRLLGRFQ